MMLDEINRNSKFAIAKRDRQHATRVRSPDFRHHHVVVANLDPISKGRTPSDNQTPMNTSAINPPDVETRSLPNLLVATLATLPSMSLIPSGSILSRLQVVHTANIFQE
jgi:hypothetical protein